MVLLANAAVGLIQLVIAVIFAVIALYIGFSVLGKITKNIDEEKELAKGNTVVSLSCCKIGSPRIQRYGFIVDR